MSVFARLFSKKNAQPDEPTLQHWRAKEVSGGNSVVKEILRSDGRERVRIFERSNHTFGIAVHRQPEDTEAWFASVSPISGAAYDSIETAEREAAVVIPWLRENKNA